MREDTQEQLRPLVRTIVSGLAVAGVVAVVGLGNTGIRTFVGMVNDVGRVLGEVEKLQANQQRIDRALGEHLSGYPARTTERDDVVKRLRQAESRIAVVESLVGRVFSDTSARADPYTGTEAKRDNAYLQQQIDQLMKRMQ